MAPARRLALQILRSVHTDELTLGEALARFRPQLADARDRALVTEIVTGCLRWRLSIDVLIEHAAGRSCQRLDPVVLDLLRLAVFQLHWLQRVPSSAVVHDSVELCRLARRRSAAGFVNAVLRRSQREGTAPLPPRPSSVDPGSAANLAAWSAYLSLSLSHPRWLADRIMSRVGPEDAERWLRFNLEPAPLCLAVPEPELSAADVVGALRVHGVEARPSSWTSDAVVVARGALPTNDRVVSQCWLQDEASHLVGRVPAPVPGMQVVDCCAAPGGKTRQLASSLGGRGLLIAADVRRARLQLLTRTLEVARLRPFVKIVGFDASAPWPFGGGFDVVLLDAPCSGVGTVRRDPELKWRRSELDLASLAERQLTMLRQAVRHIRPGGLLVYATCSSEPEENEDVVHRFLGEHSWLAQERIDRTTDIDPRLVDAAGALRTTPHAHALEAFYAARLRRVR